MQLDSFVERIACPACGAAEFETIYRCRFLEEPIRSYLETFYSPQGGVEFEYLEGAEYVLEECSHCGLVFQRNILSDELMGKLYEEWIDPAKAFGRKFQETGLASRATAAREIMMVIAWLGGEPGRLSFLDFGMGWGEWCLMAKAFGCHARGSELSAARIEHARGLGVEAIGWEEIPGSEFDFINAEQVFEHIPRPLETLLYLKRGLRPEGLIKISVPEGNGIRRKLKRGDWSAPTGSRNSLNPVAPLEHINCYVFKSVVRMAEIADLELAFIPYRIRYAYGVARKPIVSALKALLGPLYRGLFRKGTYLFFRRKRA